MFRLGKRPVVRVLLSLTPVSALLAAWALGLGGGQQPQTAPQPPETPSLPVTHLSAKPNSANEPSQTTAGILDMRMIDLDGRIHRLGLEDEVQPIVLVFLDPGCPIVQRSVPSLDKLFREAGRGFSCYGVISDPDLSRQDAVIFRGKYRLDFPILFDSSGELARRLRPTHVPEAFVIGKDDRVAYRGRIDDRFVDLGKIRQTNISEDLRDAMLAVAAGTSPGVARTTPIGCDFEAWDRADVKITYTRDIAPILNAACVECHHVGGVGPFPLQTYEQARRRAKMLARVTSSRFMPPWRAARGFGQFRHERSLSDRQIELLQAWAKAGAPEGDPNNLPASPVVGKTEWTLGKPDLVLTIPEFDLPAEGDDIYRYFVMSTNLPKDQEVVAWEIKPGNPSVVHHGIGYLDSTGKARELDKKDPKPGFALFGEANANFLRDGPMLGGWIPGMSPYRLPSGFGIPLKAGADVVLELHYHLIGKKTSDKTSIGLYLARKPVRQHVESLWLGSQEVDIRAGEANYWRHISYNVPTNMTLIDITPHMHFLGREVQVMATLPGGKQRPLVRIADWDFRWQSLYVYREPLELPRGTRIDAWYRYDNTADNASNPNSPPKRVIWGSQTTDEMCELVLTAVPRQESDRDRLQQAAVASWTRPAAPPEGWKPDRDKSGALLYTSTEAFNIKTALASLQMIRPWEPGVMRTLEQAGDEGKTDKLIEGAAALVKEKPRDVRLLTLYGTLLALKSEGVRNDRDRKRLAMEAHSAFDRALKQDPTSWDARFGKAMAYLFSPPAWKQVPDAIKQFELLVAQQEKQKQEPQFAGVYLRLVDLYIEKGEKKKAEALLAQGRKLFPKDEELQKAKVD